jgi:hypothetical protein
VSMPATTQGDSGPLQAVQPKGREEGVRKVLLVCGSLSGLVYLGSHGSAALQWDGYSRVSNAISELHLTGSPLKWLLDRGTGLQRTGHRIRRSAQGNNSGLPTMRFTATSSQRRGIESCRKGGRR